MSSTCMAMMDVSPLSERRVYTHHSHSEHENPQLRKGALSARFKICEDWRIQ